jgi:signal transduction histidine kinase
LSRDDADSFCIEVTDTGPGIAADLLPGVFERSETRQGRGLFLTRRVVEALGGCVSAENLAAGGCKFRARLPLAPSVITHDPTQRLPRIAP